MKYLFYIFSFLILFKPAFPVIEYLVNYDYIRKVLCINKDKPQLQCDGKCYLMKQLAKNASDERDKDKTERKNKVETPFVFVLKEENILPIIEEVESHEKFTFYQNYYKKTIHFKLLRPPMYVLNS